MSQLHQEALRRQVVVDKRNRPGLSLFQQKGGSMEARRNPAWSSRSVNSSSHSSLSGKGANLHSSSGNVIIRDPYLEALTSETRARTQNRFSSTDYMMQW